MSSASDIFREVLALGDRVRGLGQRVNNLGARVDASSADRFANKYSVSIKNGKSTKSVSVSGYKLEERDALREAEAKNPGWSAVSVARLDDACADADKKPAEGGKYNASAVQKEIEKDKRIKPGEAKLIHGLLKGWRGDSEGGEKADASPEMSRFQERQQARRSRAEAGIREGDALMAQVDDALRRIKKAGQTPYNGRCASAKDSVKTARAHYGLAINNLSEQSKFESWIASGDTKLGEAATNVRALVEQANSIR